MMYLAINGAGILFIVILIWWFWFSSPTIIKANTNAIIDIKVKDGTYQPAYIEANEGEPLILRFTREDESPCAEIVTFPKLNINQQLPLNQAVDIALTLEKPGVYDFTCQMGMYRGKLIIT